jgi:hypothetical protein
MGLRTSPILLAHLREHDGKPTEIPDAAAPAPASSSSSTPRVRARSSKKRGRKS